MSFYLDASAIVSFLMLEERSAATVMFVERRQDLAVSDFTVAETSSALSRLVRMRTISWDAAISALSDLDAWRARTAVNISVVGSDVRLADVFVRRFDLKLRTPDALHVALCRRLNSVLVTLDRKLAGVADELGVKTLMPA